MRTKLDLINKKFGKLLVLREVGRSKYGTYLWLCKCDCGNMKVVLSYSLRKGRTKSCGCLKKKHGLCRNRIYGVWINMVNRCENKSNKSYKDYGNRGITVCKRWHKLENFYEDMGNPPKKLSLERINNDGNYEPANCKWGSHKEQQNNSRNNRFLKYKNQYFTMAQWAKKMEINYQTLKTRINCLGWPIEKALTKKTRNYKRNHLRCHYLGVG